MAMPTNDNHSQLSQGDRPILERLNHLDDRCNRIILVGQSEWSIAWSRACTSAVSAKPSSGVPPSPRANPIKSYESCPDRASKLPNRNRQRPAIAWL